MKEIDTEPCPYCGEYFDPQEDEIVECAECGKEGSTACCIPAGRNSYCIECVEAAIAAQEE